jgi:transcriptional regulator with XRE-family HTH domain
VTSGKRIKIIREFRGLTQKELGLALGYPETSAAVRIAQYESNIRVPKKDTINKVAKVLKCNYAAIYDNDDDLGMAERTMEELFWLEELTGCSLNIFPLEKYNDKDDERVMFGKYNDCNYAGGLPPIAIVLDYPLVNEFMTEWATRYSEYRAKEISWEEYFEWKINWPCTCDDGGKFEPTVKWR